MIKLYWFLAGCVATYFAVRTPQIAIGLWKIPLSFHQVWLTIIGMILLAGLLFFILEKLFMNNFSFECWISGHELRNGSDGKIYCGRCGKTFNFK